MAANDIHFLITGQLQGGQRDGAGPAASRSVRGGTVKAAVLLSAQRGGGDTVQVSATPGEDVVVLHLAGGPSLVLHPATARDLLQGQSGAQRGADNTTDGAADGATDGTVVVAAQLRWRGLEAAAPTRGLGFLGDVLLAGFEVVTGLFRDAEDHAADFADFAASAVVARVDGGVEAGVYALQPEHLPALKGSGCRLDAVPPAPASASGQAPLLVLVHGTFVDTTSTFGKLWALHPQAVRALFDAYGQRVYALDHPTLGASPFANALTLVQALPAGARLHLATHSRGGLVAEVLARMAHIAASGATLGEADFAPFAGDAHAAQRAEMQALFDAVRSRGIAVDRIVRVACPARGTLLASQRLDAYLSVLQWGLQLAGVPVLPQLLDFLTEVARRRADPRQLPGLEAMLPGSALVQWLNSADEAIAGDLRVVAGDLEGDSIGSWLKTLLADAYYWTDNDIVVQTRSMYGGAPRTGGAQFLLDQGGQVTHFNYFANARTVQAVVQGLTLAQPPGFRVIGPLSWAGEDSGGLRAATEAGPDPSRPAVFVLPGILGSHLAAGGKRIWLSLRLVGGLSRLAYSGAPDGVLPDGPIGLIYDDLITHLAATHEVRPFAFDWRRPIEHEAQRLADALDAALDARQGSGQPVRIVAHSMGGLVARTVQLERPDTWQRLMAHPDARLLMLGTPNGGSWAPMQVLSGDDSFGNALASFGAPLQDHQARQIMAAMPGFLQLQAGLLDGDRGLDRHATWAQLAADDLQRVHAHNWWHRNWLGAESADQPLAAYAWGVPPQPVLDQARRLRERLDAQRDGALAQWAHKLLLVVGHARFTPDGYEWADGGLVYLDAVDGGDGRVPLASALLPGVATWTLDCEHGSLPDAASAFEAYDELLLHGSTERLPRLARLAAATRSGTGSSTAAPVHVRSRPARGRPALTPADSQRAVFAARRAESAAFDAAGSAALRVTVLNGNLSFVHQPLLVGHYRSLLLTGTEAAVDRLVGGAMQASLSAGLYAEAPGTHQIFMNPSRDAECPWRAPRPLSVVVVGLGDEGKLRETDLTHTVRQGVIAWSQRLAESGAAPAQFELAATLMGTGGVGIHAGAAARAIAAGVREANARLVAGGWPAVRELTLVELYLERAADAWHGLQVLATAHPGHYAITPTVQTGTGPLRRVLDSGYRGTDHDFVAATSQGEGAIAFTLDSKRARTEVRAQMTQARLVRELVKRASNASQQDPQIGRTLFQLLVPLELEPFLGGTSRMLLELDDDTATIPWELLDMPDDRAGGGDRRPWSIRCQLLRKLRTEQFREQVQDAGREDNVLVVGEPLTADGYARLPGAAAEARAVAQALRSDGGIAAQQLTALLERDDASSVVNALYARRYRIVHIAGHGEPGMDGGLVLSGGTFLGPKEIRNMRTVPELVFVNCCHGAARGTHAAAGTAPREFDRSAFAASVADALIQIGVRCVVAAGWAVDDGPAALFATTFYRQLLGGAPFVAAVAAAREAAWAQGGNTWAAYQCYGDPDWTFVKGAGAQARSSTLQEDYAMVSSPLGLALALEELAVKSRWQGARPQEQLERTRFLETRFAAQWGGMGAVAEAFALAHAEAGARDAAIAWYERALQANDGSASLKAAEQLGSLRARRAWEMAETAATDSPALTAARAALTEALRTLQTLAALQSTPERETLVGSTWKQLARLEQRAGDSVAMQGALGAAASAYGRAEALAAARGDTGLFYPALNRMALELVAHAGDRRWPGFDAAALDAARASLAARGEEDADFWSLAGRIEIEVLAAAARHRLAGQLDAALAAYADLHNRVPAPHLWATVAEQAEFVLGAYAAAARGAERSAALALQQQLAGWRPD